MQKAAAVVVANGFDLSFSWSFEGGAPCHCYALSSQLWVKLVGLRPRLSALLDSVRQPASNQNGLQLWACGLARLWLRLVQYEEKPRTHDHMPKLLFCIHPPMAEAGCRSIQLLPTYWLDLHIHQHTVQCCASFELHFHLMKLKYFIDNNILRSFCMLCSAGSERGATGASQCN